MHYIITGSAGNVSGPLVKQLLASGHNVTVIGRNKENLEPLIQAGAKAAIGTLENIVFLTETFQGADAVYTMVPPKWDVADWKGYIGSIGENYAAAIQSAGVKYVVNLSSIGAHMSEGCGPVSGLYQVEQSLNDLTNVNVKHLRAGYFYHNLFASIGMIKNAGIMGGNFGGGDNKWGMVHPTDIAEAAAEELQKLNFAGSTIRYIAGDDKTGTEIASVLGVAIGRPALTWVEFTDQQSLDGMIQAGMSEEVAKNYTELGMAIRTGRLSEDYWKHHAELSRLKLQDFVPEFEKAYNAS